MFIYYYKIWSLFTRMFCRIYLGSEKCTGGSTEIFEINLLWTWCVYIESRISRKNAAQDPLILAFCWKVKLVSIQCMAGLGNFRLEANWQYIDFDPFYTVSYGKCFTVVLPYNQIILFIIWRH